MQTAQTPAVPVDAVQDRTEIPAARTRPISLYLDTGADRAFAVLHPAGDVPRDCAVVMCPPFGWEETASHRSFRAWANQLAAAGYPTLRLTYPGSGDSGGGPRDPDRLEACTDAVAAAASWLRATSGATSVVALGMSFGALVALAATAAGAQLEGLVLWSAPARGREIVRQLKAFSRMELEESFRGLEPPPAPPEGEVAAGGFVLSAETARALGELDMTALTLPHALPRGMLLLDREGIGSTDRLAAAFRDQGVDVIQDAGEGYAVMTSEPQPAHLPPTVAGRVQAWLDERSAPAPGGAPPVDPARPGARAELELVVDGAAIVETPVEIAQPTGMLSGILTEPRAEAARVCVVFLNAGAIRRTGPGRIWAEAARRWAARGVPSLRLDLEAIGESDGGDTAYQETSSLHDPKLLDQVRIALDFLADRDVADRFVLVGMCAGAYWALHIALEDPRVSGVFLVNLRVLVWDSALGTARDLRRALATRAIMRLREPDSRARVKAIVRWLASTAWQRVRARLSGTRAPESIDALGNEMLARLQAADVRTLLLFAMEEPLETDLERWGRLAELESSDDVAVERIAVINHTLRPIFAQRRAHEILDAALERELRAGG